MSRHPAPSTTSRRQRVVVVPSRDDVVDAGYLTILMLLGLVGFRSTYSGVSYLVAGALGLVLGLLIAHLANALGQPTIAVAAMSVAVFFLLGGAVALRSTAIAGIFPSGSTLHDLATESVHGWKDLLTTLPPVDGNGPLLVLPYMLGLLGGVGGFCLARRTNQPLAGVVAPALVLVLVILLGAQTPSARVLQGTGFGIVALVWVAVRSQRRSPVSSRGSGRVVRLATLGALLAVTAAGSVVVGPHLPGAGDHRRLVLRNYVDPPFNVGQYPSPLAGFRRYTPPAKDSLNHKTLFTVSGLPAGTPVRIATLDSYDGLTWRASNQPRPTLGPAATFQRVGSTIDDPARGRAVTFSVTIASAYTGVWVPDAGALTGLAFHGSDATSQARYFRYNLGTGTGIAPLGLSRPDEYTAQAVLPRTPDLTATDALAAGVPLDNGTFAKSYAAAWAGSGSPAAQVLSIARHLRAAGRYTNGENQNAVFLPGHYRARLLAFLGGSQIAGDDEQFAAAYALLVNQLGATSRVVLGAVPERDGVVRGADVHAWIEVQLADGAWRAVPTDAFMNKDKHPQKQQQQQQQQQAGKIVPPPSRGRPHSGLDDAANAASHSSRKTAPHRRSEAAGGGVPGWVLTTAKVVGTPLLIALLLCGLIIAAKLERRRRRRTRGSPATRLERGWRELLDHALDLGTRAPGGATRREQAAALSHQDAVRLAHLADAHIFGPSHPDDTAATGFWREVDATLRRMSHAVGTRRRVLAAVNLRSFLAARRTRGVAT